MLNLKFFYLIYKIQIYNTYSHELDGLVQFQKQNTHSTRNYNYFPIVLEDEKQLKSIETSLISKNIYPRRYFYPSLDTLSYIKPKQSCSISRDISKRILCLPMYAELDRKDQHAIINTILDELQ